MTDTDQAALEALAERLGTQLRAAGQTVATANRAPAARSASA